MINITDVHQEISSHKMVEMAKAGSTLQKHLAYLQEPLYAFAPVLNPFELVWLVRKPEQLEAQALWLGRCKFENMIELLKKFVQFSRLHGRGDDDCESVALLWLRERHFREILWPR